MANIRYMRTVSMTKEFTFAYNSKLFLKNLVNISFLEIFSKKVVKKKHRICFFLINIELKLLHISTS